MTRLSTTALIIVGCAASLVSCGRVWKGSSDKKMQQQDSALAYKWKTDCVSSSALDLSHARRAIELSVLGNFEKDENFYSTDKCEKSQITYKVLGTYAALAENPVNKEVKNINFTINKTLLVAHTDDAVKNLNKLKMCGIDTWKSGKEIDITNKSCAGITVKRGDVVADVYQIKNKALYFGQKFLFLAGGDVSSRPDKVAADVIYNR